MSEPVVQELLDREAIKELKARYFRLLDGQDWAAWSELFTADVRVGFPGMEPIVGVEALLAAVRHSVEGATTIHHGHMPEIDLESPGVARGTWAVADTVEYPADPATGVRQGRKGLGRYDESYVKGDDGRWRIATLDLSYARVEPFTDPPAADPSAGPR